MQSFVSTYLENQQYQTSKKLNDTMHLLTLIPHDPSLPSVVTIGNFDGLHLGHQQLIQAVLTEAAERKAVSAVVLFEPQPLEFFRPDAAPPRLMSLGEKIYRLRQLGVHRVGLIRFSPQIAQLSAEAFVQQLLVQQLRATSVWVGDDFRFGANRAGDFVLMQQLGRSYHFSVAQTPSATLDNRRLSSTWLREVLQQGDMSTATTLLGAPYQIRGRVVHGQKLGRTIGFPTMNIVFKQKPAVSGVFVVRIHGLSDAPLTGVANVGIRPTLSGTQHRLEAHVFDWQGNAYGRHVTIELCHRLRGEQKFASLDALKAQIQQDVAQARRFIDT
jgi:riboflavin kinase/FMN adenylyltransferase